MHFKIQIQTHILVEMTTEQNFYFLNEKKNIYKVKQHLFQFHLPTKTSSAENLQVIFFIKMEINLHFRIFHKALSLFSKVPP